MTLTEQQVFEETRDRIQRNLSEIAGLSRSGNTPHAFFARFVELAIDCIGAQGAALWILENDKLLRLAEINFESSGYDDEKQKAWIEAVLGQTISARRPHIVAAEDPSFLQRDVPPGEIGNTLPCPFFYQPIFLGNQVTAILQIWLPHAGDPATYNDISLFLAQLSGHAQTYLQGWQGTQLSAKNEQAQTMLRLQSEFVGELDPKILQNATANYLVDLLHADLACVFKKKKSGWSLVAASNQEVVDPRAIQSRTLSEVGKNLEVTTTGGVAEKESTQEPLRAALEEAGIHRIAWCHLASSKNSSNDYLLVAAKNEDKPLPANAQELIMWCSTQFAKALDVATHFHHIPLRPIASAAGRTIRAWKQDRRRKVLAFVVAPLAILAAILAIPIPWKVGGECIVEPTRKAFVVAETPGKVVKVAVKEGEIVKAGQLLAKLDDTDYVTQLAVSRQQLLRWQVEAGKAQALGNEAERKIAELGAARESEAIHRIEYLQSRTELRSPIDGMVLTRNLSNREGEALEIGKTFCEIGSIGSHELEIEIKQKELGDVLSALNAGRKLPVDFILHPHPTISLTTTLSGASSVSQVPELRKTGSVFFARAPFPENSPLDKFLKPGFTGKAKIRLGYRPIGWIISRPFINYLRAEWGV